MMNIPSTSAKRNVLSALSALQGSATIKELIALFATKNCRVTYNQVLNILCHLFKEDKVSFYYVPKLKDDVYYIV